MNRLGLFEWPFNIPETLRGKQWRYVIAREAVQELIRLRSAEGTVTVFMSTIFGKTGVSGRTAAVLQELVNYRYGPGVRIRPVPGPDPRIAANERAEYGLEEVDRRVR